MAYPPYGAPVAVEATEVHSLKSLLYASRIVALVFCILLLLGGLLDILYSLVVISTCSATLGISCGPGIVAVLPGAITTLIFGVVDGVIYIEVKETETLVDQRRYEEAKGKTLVWMIIGFVLGGIIPGILLLIAWLKYDPVINLQRSQAAFPPSGYAQAPGAGSPMAPGAPMAQAPVSPTQPSPPPQPAPAAIPSAPMAYPTAAPTTTCPRCGRPAMWVAQYGRWFCPTEQQYL